MSADLSEISISIALVTRNRPALLNRCLESLRSQSIQPYEVVVSDDSDLDFTHEVKAIAERWDCRYIKGPRRGLYANRNYAALACKGTHIRTMDDDHILPAGHMEQCMIAVSSDPKSIWTTGEIGFMNGKYCDTALTANQLYPSGVGGSVLDLNDNWAIADGSTIYPREVFDQGHRMIEWFSFGSSYLEFGAYLYYHGFRSRCIPQAFIEHYADENTWLRVKHKRVVQSQLYASLCFNLYFRPNYIQAVKYIFAYLLRSGLNTDLLLSLPELLLKVKNRWKSNPLC